MARNSNKPIVSKSERKTRFVLGIVGIPFGLEGFVKVKPLSGETDHFRHLEKVTLLLNEKEKTCEIAEIVLRKESLLIRFTGINNPEAAEVLGGARIIAGREYAAPLKKGEYYIEDLKGFDVITGEGEILGHITDILEGGGGQLAEIELLSGEIRLVPYRKEFFGEPNIEKSRIELLKRWILE